MDHERNTCDSWSFTGVQWYFQQAHHGYSSTRTGKLCGQPHTSLECAVRANVQFGRFSTEFHPAMKQYIFSGTSDI